MKYTISGFQQSVLLAYGLGVDETIILRTIVDFWFSKKMDTKDFDGIEYFYLSYSFLVNELPILKIDRAQMYNKMMKFVECGLMNYQVERLGKGSKAYFTINEEMYMPLIQVPGTETLAKKKENNNFVDPVAAERTELKIYFFDLYLQKAKEITGSQLTPEGRLKNPTWAAKEASLLLKDWTAFGLDGMKRFMRLFFSDSVETISSFTRYQQKAGYSYVVFHGMLSKISILEQDAKDPCPECGRWRGHTLGCANDMAPVRRAEERAELEKELATRDVDDIALVNMFNEKIHGTPENT